MSDADLPLIADQALILREALDLWATRDDSKAQPEVRKAANDAMDATDAILGELHKIRARIMNEIHESDAAADVRIDALLARRRATAPLG